MPQNEENTLPRPSRAARKKAAKRKSAIVRYFVDNHIAAPTEITPKWQRAVDTYNQAKRNSEDC